MISPIYVTLSVVLFTIIDHELKIVLIKRSRDPYLGYRCLPWWYIDWEKSAEQTLTQKLFQKTWLHNIYLEQVHAFTDPERDSRYRSINIAYLSAGIYHDLKNISTYGEVEFHSIKNLPTLAFDHGDIIVYIYQILQQRIITSNIAQFFLPRQFTLRQLQEVYDTVRWYRSDVRNFRNFIYNQNIVKNTWKKQTKVSYRPAYLFEFIHRDINIAEYN